MPPTHLKKFLENFKIGFPGNWKNVIPISKPGIQHMHHGKEVLIMTLRLEFKSLGTGTIIN